MSNEFIPDIVGPVQAERKAEQDILRRAINVGRREGLLPAGTSRASGKKKKSPLDSYTQALQKMLQGSYRQPYDELTNQLNTMGQQAEGTVGSSMDQLQQFLQGQANPYTGFKAQQTQVSPALSGLLQSQGVSTDPLQQYAATINAENTGQATAFQNLANTLGSLYGAQQQGALTDVAQNRANLQSQLAASRMGMGSQINQQAMGQRNQLMELLLSALAKGGQPRGGRLF